MKTLVQTTWEGCRKRKKSLAKIWIFRATGQNILHVRAVFEYRYESKPVGFGRAHDVSMILSRDCP